MKQSITRLPDIHKNGEAYLLEVSGGKIISMLNNVREIEHYKLSGFVMDVLQTSPYFFDDQEQNYAVLADYCAAELENDDTVVNGIIGTFIPEMKDTWETVYKVARMDPVLRADMEIVYGYHKENDSWGVLQDTLENIIRESRASQRFSELFRESDSFTEITSRMVQKEFKSYIQIIEERCWDAIRNILTAYIKKEKRANKKQ